MHVVPHPKKVPIQMEMEMVVPHHNDKAVGLDHKNKRKGKSVVDHRIRQVPDLLVKIVMVKIRVGKINRIINIGNNKKSKNTPNNKTTTIKGNALPPKTITMTWLSSQ